MRKLRLVQDCAVRQNVAVRQERRDIGGDSENGRFGVYCEICLNTSDLYIAIKIGTLSAYPFVSN